MLDIEITEDNMPIHLEYLIKKIDTIDQKLDKNYITRFEFQPIQRLVYGMVMLILAGVIAAVVKAVL